MNEPLVSIIIPVYNVSQYLRQCLDSVISQTYKNLEIILVDDGSTDRSGAMCDEYKTLDLRIKVLHKENGGLSSARNAGMKLMKGEYFSFIDSDDYIRTDYIGRMYSYIVRDRSDIVVCSFKKVIGDENYAIINRENTEHYKFNQEEIKLKMLSRQIPMYAHGKLYRTELAIRMEFPLGRLYEDVPTIWNAIKYINQVTYINNEMYFYRQRLNSIVNGKFTHGRMDLLYFSEKILKELDKGDCLYNIAMTLCFFAAADNYCLVTNSFPDDKSYLKRRIKEYRTGVIKDKNAQISLKVMAGAAYVSPEIVRIIGKIYKKHNYYKWKKMNKRNLE